LSFSDVEAANGAPDDLRQLVRGVLVADGDRAFKEARPYLQPPGVEGNTAWDNKAVVDIILRHDKLNGGRVASFMVANSMSKAMLWPVVVKVLRKAGFDMHRGRIVGYLEHTSKNDG
jgi:hypothetical protein